MKDVLASARVLSPDGSAETMGAEELGLSYRHSALEGSGRVLTGASSACGRTAARRSRRGCAPLAEKRRASQPLEWPSAGSTFKRPQGGYAAAMIDQAGLKGLAVGGAKVSEKHAGFIINAGGATYADVTALIAEVQRRVFERFGVMLEPEVRILGRRAEPPGVHGRTTMESLSFPACPARARGLTADILEDMGYYCVDNMPVALLPRFAELCRAAGGKYERVALVTDVREGESLSQLFATLDGLWSTGLEYRILFVEADVQTLVRRYKSSRRRHPLMSPGDSIEDAIARETARAGAGARAADYIINTTGLTTAALQSRIAGLLSLSRERRLAVTVTAFGYKYGLPLDADLVLDVRFLPNPYYVEELRPLSGLDAPVYGFVLGARARSASWSCWSRCSASCCRAIPRRASTR